MPLDNLCIILIDLSTAVLLHLNRLLADRSLNLLLKVIFHTWLSHGQQVADDPVAKHFQSSMLLGVSKLRVCYRGQ